MAVQSARPGHAPNVIMEPGSRGARGSGMRVQSHPAHARSSGSETLSRSRSLVGYTIDTHESEVFGSHSRWTLPVPCKDRSSAASIDRFAVAVRRFRFAVGTSLHHHYVRI